MINFSKNLITRLATYAIDNPASFLKRTAALNFSVGSVGLIIGMIINKNIPEKEKRFMIIQEATEGVLDLGVFLGCATAFEKIGRWLVKTKKLVPHIDNFSKEQVKDAITKFFANPNKPGISMLAESKIRTWVKAAEVGAGLIGTIIAFNVITPLIRNYIASKLEKNIGKKMDKTQTYSPILPATKLNQPISFNKNDPFASFNSAMTTGKLPQRAYLPVFTSTGMRV
jgi:hypothetical protein